MRAPVFHSFALSWHLFKYHSRCQLNINEQRPNRKPTPYFMRLTDASKTVNTFALMNMLSVRGVKCCSRPATWSELTECAPAASVVTVSSMRLSALIGRTPLDYPNVHTPAGLARIHTIHLSAAWLTEIDSMRHIKRHAHTNSNRQYKTAAWTEQLKWHHEIFPPPPKTHWPRLRLQFPITHQKVAGAYKILCVSW